MIAASRILLASAAAALRQVASRPLRRLLWRTLGLTLLILVALWALLTRLARWLLDAHPLSADYAVLNTAAFFLAGFGLLVLLLYLLPAISVLVAGYYLDDAALAVEGSDYPADPPGRPLALGRSLLSASRFAVLSLVVNLVALALVFVPVVNVGAFFAANTYLFGREYFELAAGRFRSPTQAAKLRRDHPLAVYGAGAILAGLLLVPIVNLATPLFGIALMVHVHKRLAGPRRLASR